MPELYTQQSTFPIHLPSFHPPAPPVYNRSATSSPLALRNRLLPRNPCSHLAHLALRKHLTTSSPSHYTNPVSRLSKANTHTAFIERPVLLWNETDSGPRVSTQNQMTVARKPSDVVKIIPRIEIYNYYVTTIDSASSMPQYQTWYSLLKYDCHLSADAQMLCFLACFPLAIAELN